jgi:hypothetical protein
VGARLREAAAALSNNAERPKPGRASSLPSLTIGTNDCTPFYCLPDTIQTMGAAPQGWPDVMKHNRTLSLRARHVARSHAAHRARWHGRLHLP